MSKDIQKAIERLKQRIKDNEDYKTTQVWLTDDVVATITVLNYIETLKKENKNLERKLKIKDGDVLYLQNKIRKHFIEDIEIAKKIKELENDPNNIGEKNYLRADTCYAINILEDLLKNK